MPDLASAAYLTLPAERIEDARRAVVSAFRAGGIETPALDARLLVLAACGLSHADLIRDPDQPLTPQARSTLESMAARRLAGVTVSRILGQRDFWGLSFRLSPETLDPRADTETVVEAVLAALSGRETERLRLLDLGTGSGCLLAALLSELPNAWGVGTDISHAALLSARENALRAGVGARGQFVQADWLAALCGLFDVVVSNPPYIANADLAGLSPEVRDHDPLAALDGGADGLVAYRAILGDVTRVLRPGGLVAFEVGAGQAEAVTAMMHAAGLTCVAGDGAVPRCDLGGIERALVMRRPELDQLAKKELESSVIHDSL
jgi:release factor glutamine methyltransferase